MMHINGIDAEAGRRQRRPAFWLLAAEVMRRVRWGGLLMLCGLLTVLAGPASGDEDQRGGVVSEPLGIADEPVNLDVLLGESGLLTADQLDEERARAMLEINRIQINEQELTGVVTDNVAINTVNGHNTISGEAFSSSTGFVNSIQNTGNNVLIQSATIVNIAVEP